MTVTDLQFSGAEELQVENYRPLCGLALISFLVGIAAPLAVFSSYLLPVPPLGILLSIGALRRIRASGNEMSGRRLALAALVLSCFFGAWAVAQYVGRPWVISQQARRVCDGWLQLMLEDKVIAAYQWTLSPGSRVGATLSPTRFYEANKEAAAQRDNYFQSLPFQTDARGSSLKSFRFLGNNSVTENEAGEATVIHSYEIVHESNGQTKVSTVWLTVVRLPPDENNFIHWEVRDVRLPYFQGI